MNKLSSLGYTKRIANVLNRVYGDMLIDGDIDIQMAKTVLRSLNDFLYFREILPGERKEFNKWKNTRGKK